MGIVLLIILPILSNVFKLSDPIFIYTLHKYHWTHVVGLSETTTLKVTFILQWAFQQRSWTSFNSLILLDIIVILLMFLFGACPISYSYITTSSTISHVCGWIILGTLNPHTLVCFDITFESISSGKPFSKLCC